MAWFYQDGNIVSLVEGEKSSKCDGFGLRSEPIEDVNVTVSFYLLAVVFCSLFLQGWKEVIKTCRCFHWKAIVESDAALSLFKSLDLKRDQTVEKRGGSDQRQLDMFSFFLPNKS